LILAIEVDVLVGRRLVEDIADIEADGRGHGGSPLGAMLPQIGHLPRGLGPLDAFTGKSARPPCLQPLSPSIKVTLMDNPPRLSFLLSRRRRLGVENLFFKEIACLFDLANQSLSSKATSKRSACLSKRTAHLSSARTQLGHTSYSYYR
jgi:hypothetical protein